MNPLILQVDGFGKHFQLHEQGKLIPSSYDVSFSVRSGQLTALIGPTGAGKSSVLKGIYRSYLPSAGRILYRNAMGHELDLALASEHQILELRRREIAFVTQFLHCLPRQSTLDVVAQLWSVSPATFSGGERQRVNLARGFIAKPRLLLLDEPTASLDPKTAECVISLIDGLKFEGTAMLAIFHNPETTRRLADQVVELAMPPAVEDILKEIA